MGRKTEAAPPARRVNNTALHYAAPALICASAMPVAEVAHLAWGHDGIMTMAMTAVAGGLTWMTHQTWHKRHEKTRALATAFAASVTGWTVAAAVTDPFGHAQVNAWALGGIFLSVAWHIRHHGLTPAAEADKRTRPDDGLGVLARTVNSLKGAKAVSVSESPDGQRVSARVRLKKPTAGSEVQADKSAIASALSVGEDQVSVSGVPGRADMVDVAVTKPDMLGATVRWTPAPDSELGLSVADKPLIIGLRKDGRPLELWACGQDATDTQEARVLGHILCTGVPGSGKTETVRNIIMLGRDRRDFVPVVGDPEKFGQSFGDIADTLGIAAKNEQQTRQLVRNIPGAVRYRAELLGSLERADGGTGYKQWGPECWDRHGVPLVFIDIEEAASVLEGDNEDFDKAVRTARSVGILICASLQTAIHSNMERKTRGLLTQTLAHGCTEMQDAKFSLSPGTLDAGADPTKWGANVQGSLYAELVGTPSVEWAVDARSFWIDPKQKREALDRSKAAGHWAVLDAGTAMALGKGIVVPDEKITSVLPRITPDAEDPEESSVYVDQESEEFDVSVPIPPSRHAQPFTLRTPPARMGTAEARALFERRIDELEASQHAQITFEDLADMTQLTGRQRSWVYDQLTRLEKEGRLKPVEGERLTYRIRPRVINGTSHF